MDGDMMEVVEHISSLMTGMMIRFRRMVGVDEITLHALLAGGVVEVGRQYDMLKLIVVFTRRRLYVYVRCVE